jgi:predicted RNase H-like nuclease (RuvC/YqgF family)
MTVDLPTLLTVLTLLAGGSGIAGIIVALATRNKSKADATKIIQEAAGELVTSTRTEADRWRKECTELRTEVDTLSGKVDETTACQTMLKGKVETLEWEKKQLTIQVATLTEKVKALEEENKRLKQNRDNEKEEKT